MTGDAVNDAAALKQADVGVAMGSGSEVTKQAGKIVLTDDNFATLVRAVDLGRDIYRRISSYVKLQLTILSSVLQLMLLATILEHQRRRRAVPDAAAVLQVLRGRHGGRRVHRRRAGPGRHAAAAAQARARIVTRPRSSAGSSAASSSPRSHSSCCSTGRTSRARPTGPVSMTMAFAFVALTAVNIGLVMRRERERALVLPDLPVPRVDHPRVGAHLGGGRAQLLQRLLDTVSLTGGQWVLVLGLSLITPRSTPRQGHPAPPASTASSASTPSSASPQAQVTRWAVADMQRKDVRLCPSSAK